LLRRLLRLHRRLPSFERQLGDSYVKHEFRLHRKVPDDKFLSQFYKQWESYADMLEATAGINGSQGDDHKIGQNLDKNIINKMSDEMVGQLYELHKA
ncbi:ACN9-domain-containing protein, partial [Ramicandelaber brevisporus]